MRIIRNLFIVGVLAIVFSASRANSDTIFGEFKRLPDAIERGFSVGFDFGLLFFPSQPALTTASTPGFNLMFTTGYDFMDYLSVEGIYQFGIAEADPNDPILHGSTINALFGAAARGQIPLGRFYPFVEVGPAVHFSDPSWFTTNENWKMAIMMGAGIEYYSYLRHYSLYAKTMYNYIQSVPIDTLTVSIGIKYTF